MAVESESPREIGVGLISVGWMGKLHTRAYQAMPSVYPELGLKCRLVIAADTAPDRVEYAKNVLGYERGTTDYREVLNDPDVDVVSICAPNMLHREIGIAAAKAGKPFWIEKPVGLDATDTAEIAAAAAKAQLVTSVGFNYRDAPAVAHIRELVTGGELGRVTGVRCVGQCTVADAHAAAEVVSAAVDAAERGAWVRVKEIG